MIEGKEYKLKKDIITPEETIPAGAVFDFRDGVGSTVDYYHIVAQDLVKDFDEWFEEVEHSLNPLKALSDGLKKMREEALALIENLKDNQGDKR